LGDLEAAGLRARIPAIIVNVMSDRTQRLLTIALTLAVLFSAPAAWCQRQPNHRVITKAINDCENRTDQFIGTLRKALNHSGLRDTSREDDLLRSAKDLEKSMDRVGDSWNRDKDVVKARQHVRDALDAARNINRAMRNRRLDRDAEQQWANVRRELNLLARAFDLPEMRW
jgi:hypothetical protein